MYWLMKSEPDVFSIFDLKASPKQTTPWEGVRNYQARNYMRDQMKTGDGVLFYHSNTNPLAIVGTMEVASEPYPDPTQFNPASEYFDPKSTETNPRWMLVDVRLLEIFKQPVTRQVLMGIPELSEMLLLQRGSRLSVQPVRDIEWQIVHKLAQHNLKL